MDPGINSPTPQDASRMLHHLTRNDIDSIFEGVSLGANRAEVTSQFEEELSSQAYSTLVSRLIDYQQKGTPGFLRGRSLNIEILPEADFDSAKSRAEESLKDLMKTLSIKADEITICPSSNGVIFYKPSNFNGDFAERIDAMFKEHLPLSITSSHYLRTLISAHFDSSDSIPYIAYIERLPVLSELLPTVRVNVEQIVLNLLEAGELSGVNHAAISYLIRSGISEEVISGLYRQKEHDRRQAFGKFVSCTGTSPYMVASLEQLDELAADAKRCLRERVYTDYLNSLKEDVPDEVLERVVRPLAARGGKMIRKSATAVLENR